MDEFSNGKDMYNAAKKNAAYRNERESARPPNVERRVNPPSQEAAPAVSEAQMLEDCKPYLKDGETPVQCIERERKDTAALLRLLAKERERTAPVLPTNPIERNVERLNREQIKQEIRELDALRMDAMGDDVAELCYHRINELLDMLDNEP